MKVSRDTIRHWEAERYAARLARQNDPLDNAALARELRAWLMVHWIPAQNQPELLDEDAMQAWLKQADENGGLVYIGRIWSVTGLPQSFDTWAAP
jgi:hypothetical protein